MSILYYVMLSILAAFAIYGFIRFIEKPAFIFHIDATDPDDVKVTMEGQLDFDAMKNGHKYVVMVERKDKDSRDN